ncbi:MAG: 3-methyl-2-oxobutanoate hydroxymethyltransferase [Desulfovibrio sp.]|jgi:3-methyl-2-oxobutanoate hydroxymethyltransferase|nr:3-methyl-2-oxobutanoate hydroxymethyltransferase [Desulfovibrio sp.]
MKNTVLTFREAKGREKLVMLTAYDFSTAKIMDRAGVNALLVGDSLGNVMLGHKNTLSVTLEDMLRHCAAVARASENALVVCDLPFMSYRVSREEAMRSGMRLLAEGMAQAVKLEGGADFCPVVRELTKASIPVMGHIGLTPQSVHAMGGFRLQGKTLTQAQIILDDARALEEAGAFALVLECVPAVLGQRITREVGIPVIGIGAGPGCDGQVLVWQDMLGLTDNPAKFVKVFSEMGQAMAAAFAAYAGEVRAGVFPGMENSYGALDEADFEGLR